MLDFANAEDRGYYISKDPVHLAFIKSLDGMVKSVRVLDFEAGVF